MFFENKKQLDTLLSKENMSVSSVPQLSQELPKNEREIRLSRAGGKPCTWKMSPPAGLEGATAYKCSNCRVPISTALERYKTSYPEKFIDSSDAKAHEIFERYQKALKFWKNAYGTVEVTQVEIECYQEIQAIRAHLWNVILSDRSLQAQEAANRPINRVINFILSNRSTICALITVSAIATISVINFYEY